MNVMEKGEKSVLCAGVKERENAASVLAREGNDARNVVERESILGEIVVLNVMELDTKSVSVVMVQDLTDVRSALVQEVRHATNVKEPEK